MLNIKQDNNEMTVLLKGNVQQFTTDHRICFQQESAKKCDTLNQWTDWTP